MDDRAETDSSTELAQSLARGLRPFVDGAFAGLFDGPTTHPATGRHLVVWSLRELPEQLRSLATMLVLDTIWRTVTHPHDRRRRIVVVDEAWLLLQHPAGARFLLRAAKAGRKHWCGLTVATQDTADVLASDLGRAVITNSATQILLRQAPQAIDQVSRVFGLSAGERALLLTVERGEGLITRRRLPHPLRPDRGGGGAGRGGAAARPRRSARGADPRGARCESVAPATIRRARPAVWFMMRCVRYGMTPARVAALLNTDRDHPPLLTLSGRPSRWSARAVRNLLTDPVLTGHSVWGRSHHGRPRPRQEWIISAALTHPPIVDRATVSAMSQLVTAGSVTVASGARRRDRGLRRRR